MWPFADQSLLLIGPLGYCALLLIILASWFEFRRHDSRTGFELLVTGWLLVYLNISCGIVQSFMTMSADDPFDYSLMLIETQSVLASTAIPPFVMSVPLTIRLMTAPDRKVHREQRLFLAALMCGLFDLLLLYSLVLRMELLVFE